VCCLGVIFLSFTNSDLGEIALYTLFGIVSAYTLTSKPAKNQAGQGRGKESKKRMEKQEG